LICRWVRFEDEVGTGVESPERRVADCGGRELVCCAVRQRRKGEERLAEDGAGRGKDRARGRRSGIAGAAVLCQCSGEGSRGG